MTIPPQVTPANSAEEVVLPPLELSPECADDTTCNLSADLVEIVRVELGGADIDLMSNLYGLFQEAIHKVILSERAASERRGAERMREEAKIAAATFGGLFDLPDPSDGPFTQQDQTIEQCKRMIAEKIDALPLSKDAE